MGKYHLKKLGLKPHEEHEIRDPNEKFAHKLNDAFQKMVVEDGKSYELQARPHKDAVKVTPYFEDNLLLTLNITGSIYVERMEEGFKVSLAHEDNPSTVIRDNAGVIIGAGERRMQDFEVLLDSKKALYKLCAAFYKDCKVESENAEALAEGLPVEVPLTEWGKGRMAKLVNKATKPKNEPEACE